MREKARYIPIFIIAISLLFSYPALLYAELENPDYLCYLLSCPAQMRPGAFHSVSLKYRWSQTNSKGGSTMKKLIILLTIAIALAGCGREAEQIDADAAQSEVNSRILTLAWHKVTEDDGSVCELSIASGQMVDQASEELGRALAPNNIEVEIETLTPEKVEGGVCLCNRVLVQGRFVDEWLGADLVKTECSGCPNQTRCSKTAESDGCGGQYAMIHQGGTYSVVPANLITMAGIIAAADLTGEEIAYSGHTKDFGVNCTCGKCEDGRKCGECDHGCKHHTAGVECSPDCPGMTAGAKPPCQAGGDDVTVTKVPAAAPKKGGCPGAANCRKGGCPSKASGS